MSGRGSGCWRPVELRYPSGNYWRCCSAPAAAKEWVPTNSPSGYSPGSVRFAVAHNHPSGDPTPSERDIDATRRIAEAARAADLRFLDHVIIAGTRWNRVHI
jgi:hypothetical protein